MNGAASGGGPPGTTPASGPAGAARRARAADLARWTSGWRERRGGQAIRLAAAGSRRLAGLAGAAYGRWRNSLQVRVVTTTLILSAAVVTILGFLLMQQISAGILQTKVNQATALVRDGQQTAEQQAAAGSGDPRALMLSVVQQLSPKNSAGTAADYDVGIIPTPGSQVNPDSGGWTVGLQRPGDAQLNVPARLVQQVTALQRTGGEANLRTLVETSARLGPGHPLGLLFGVPVNNSYQLYYFFPLTQEEQSLNLVQRTLLAASIALVFLLVGIAALVTRWVVVPVRGAATAARRLATGNLDERVPVRGSDEVAVLASAFNEMAASLQDKVTELEELSQVQRQFVSDVSHELRTPLTTIRLAAEVLHASRGQLDDAAAHSAELLQSQLGRFEALLTDLLEISRFDANVAVLDAEPVDICDLVRHSADVAQQLAERRGAKIEFRLPAEPCVADADRRRVERILRNLLVNAVEHGDGKDVMVTVAADSAAVAVAVRDYGVGLAPGEEHQVFERFWRADPSRARTIGGTGLGLAIALEDARLHGGWLEAWGRPKCGSVFRLTLPRVVGAELAGSPLPLVPDDLPPASPVFGEPGAAALPDGVGGPDGVAGPDGVGGPDGRGADDLAAPGAEAMPAVAGRLRHRHD